VSAPPLRDEDHPERLAVLAHVTGERVIEIGCGPRKTDERFIGVDLTPRGVDGSVGNAEGRASQAEICADGQLLPIRNGVFDCVVARHNLEHYVNTIAVLREWQRVLSPGGRGIFVVPDEGSFPGRTVELDPTHYHSFDGPYLTQLLELLGWTVIVCEPCVENWSIIVVAQVPKDFLD
jgi:SAM-dependent methyltransferase